jgi:hypothetical protein
MSYNQRNKLFRIQDVKNKFNEVYTPGMVVEWVYINHIKKQFRISRATFYEFMKVDVKKELEKLEKNNNGQTHKTLYRQTTMDFFNQQS